jgi:tRNA (uracil-5-)-methyltransferase
MPSQPTLLPTETGHLKINVDLEPASAMLDTVVPRHLDPCPPVEMALGHLSLIPAPPHRSSAPPSYHPSMMTPPTHQGWVNAGLYDIDAITTQNGTIYQSASALPWRGGAPVFESRFTRMYREDDSGESPATSAPGWLAELFTRRPQAPTIQPLPDADMPKAFYEIPEEEEGGATSIDRLLPPLNVEFRWAVSNPLDQVPGSKTDSSVGLLPGFAMAIGAQQRWSIAMHPMFSKRARQWVMLVLCCNNRLAMLDGVKEAAPPLPHELWPKLLETISQSAMLVLSSGVAMSASPSPGGVAVVDELDRRFPPAALSLGRKQWAALRAFDVSMHGQPSPADLHIVRSRRASALRAAGQSNPTPPRAHRREASRVAKVAAAEAAVKRVADNTAAAAQIRNDRPARKYVHNRECRYSEKVSPTTFDNSTDVPLHPDFSAHPIDDYPRLLRRKQCQLAVQFERQDSCPLPCLSPIFQHPTFSALRKVRGASLCIHDESASLLLIAKLWFCRFCRFLRDVGGGLTVIPSEPLHWRLRCRLGVHRDALGTIVGWGVGPGSDTLASLPIASHRINALMPLLLEALQAYSALGAASLVQALFLTTLGTEDACVTLVYAHIAPPAEQWAVEAANVCRALGISLIGRARGVTLSAGPDYVEERLIVRGMQRPLVYRQAAGSFSNPNGDVNQKVLGWLRECCGMIASEHGSLELALLELYCGCGNHTCAVASVFSSVVAVELDPRLVELARYNLATNGIEHATVFQCTSEDFALRAIDNFASVLPVDGPTHFDAILLDPPRAGLDERTLELAGRFQHIVIISCNQEQLKQTLSALETTHAVRKFAFFDHFPFTAHTETGVWLSKHSLYRPCSAAIDSY